MPKGLIRFEYQGYELFTEWSTVVDAPTTEAATEAPFREAMVGWYGTDGTRDIDDRIARCRKTGTSFHGETLRDVVAGNRAGHDERCLTLAELVEVLGRRIDAPPGVGHLHESLGDCYTCALCYPDTPGATMPSSEDIGLPLPD